MDKPLLTLTKKDFTVQYFSGRGAGGQHRNKHQNCCRITHPASGVVGTGTESRSRKQNRYVAFRRLVDSAKFRAWLKIQSLHANAIEDAVRDALAPENLKIEILNDNKWEEVK